MDALDRRTFEDYGYDREEWLPIFERMDVQDGLQPEEESPAAVLRGEAVASWEHSGVPEGARMINSGGDFAYQGDQDGCVFHGRFSPALRYKEGLLVEGWFSYDDLRFSGEGLEDAYLAIINATQAPYLDRDLSDDDLKRYVNDGDLGSFNVPADYDEDALEESITAAVDRLSAAAALQDAVAETAAQFTDQFTAEDTTDDQQ